MTPARRAYAKKDSPVILTESFSTVTDESIRRRQEQVIRAWVELLIATLLEPAPCPSNQSS